MKWFEGWLDGRKNPEDESSPNCWAHRTRLEEERERANYAFEARQQAIGRIGLPAVREHRRKRLLQEHESRLTALAEAEASVPDLNAVMMVQVSDEVLSAETMVEVQAV